MAGSPRHQYALYPGCLILQRMPDYEMAARAVLHAVGVDVRTVQEPVCCGAPIAESFSVDWVHLSAYNLARVHEMGSETVVTLCGSCANAFTRARLALRDDTTRSKATRRLRSIGLKLGDDVEVKHLVMLLMDRLDDIRTRVVRDLGLRVAITNPCQAFRPGDVTGHPNPMEPQEMRRLLDAVGVEVVPYGGEDECCGATLFLADPRLSLASGRRKLEATREADVLVHCCGNCHLLLRHLQHRIDARDADTGVPLRRQAMFLPQILGLAMGLPPAALGLRHGL